ncbi:MAG: DEAD/DEAH box helicase [Ruminococcus sp.]|nr:DEAD/DEAH box helicase [Ruminococcus sp.]
MSDLIVSINIDESKKRDRIIIETYEGSIPHLKSKKFSGQLRSVDINANNTYDNLDYFDFEKIKKVLTDSSNIQMNKYQHIASPKTVRYIESLLSLNCFFYQYKKVGMYLIETISINKTQNTGELFFEGTNISIGGSKTSLYLIVKETLPICEINNHKAIVYINILEKGFPLRLLFEYDSFFVDYLENNRSISDGTIRDYGFEEGIKSLILHSGWGFKKSDGFYYCGSDIRGDIEKLHHSGIQVFTNQEKRIISADFSSIRVSYDIDWFSINGDVEADGQNIDIETLLSLRKSNNTWVEYRDSIIFLPQSLLSKSIKVDKKTKTAKLDKKQISAAIMTAHDTNGSVVHNMDSLVSCDSVSLAIDDDILNILRPYQIVGVKWLLSLKHIGFGACLADDMGLGKTLQIIAFLNDKAAENKHNLVIAPKTLIVNWQREIEKFSPKTDVYIYHGKDRNYSEVLLRKIVITTYQTLLNDVTLFSGFHFDNLIIDEAQNIKNKRSKTYKAISSVSASTKIILTGTPIENNISEFIGLMKLINPDIVMDKYIQTSVVEESAISRIRMMSAPFILRRMKSDVLQDLPEKQEQVICVKMEEDQRRIYDKVLNSIRYEIQRKPDKYEIKSNSTMLKGLLYLQEICCHPQLLDHSINEGCKESAKFDLLNELLQTLYYSSHKVVVFSRFTRMLGIIRNSVVAMHMNYYYLDGKTQDRLSVVDAFEESSNGVFLISLKAGGTGINLTSADTVIIYDPWWNPSAEKQAEDRIYRIGQTQKVMIYRLITEDSVEEKVQELQTKKSQLAGQLLDDRDSPVDISAELIKQMFLE